jgi:hypothetical protein
MGPQFSRVGFTKQGYPMHLAPSAGAISLPSSVPHSPEAKEPSPEAKQTLDFSASNL